MSGVVITIDAQHIGLWRLQAICAEWRLEAALTHAVAEAHLDIAEAFALARLRAWLRRIYPEWPALATDYKSLVEQVARLLKANAR
jgi:hypothetical protein